MTQAASMKYNIGFMFLSHILMAFSGAWAVIQIIFYKDLGLDFLEISAILSAGTITNVLLEMPTGVLADLYGRKASVVISFLLSMLAGFMLIFVEGFWGLLFVSITYGVGFSFWSGAFEAMLYESLDELGWREKYTTILAKSNFFFTLIGIATNYYTPIAYEIDMRYPFYVTAAIATLLAVGSIFLSETETPKETTRQRHKFINQVKNSLRFIAERNNLMFVFAYGSIWMITIGIFGSLLNQPLIYEQYELSDYGAIFAITTAIQSVIVFFTNNIISLLKRTNPYFVMVIAWSLSLAGMVEFLDNLYLLAPIMAVSWSIGSIVYILTSNDMNHIIDDDEIRATTLSINSMLKSLVFAIGISLAGGMVEYVGGVKEATLILSISSLVLGLAILVKYPRKDIAF